MIRLGLCCLLGDIKDVPKFGYRTMTKTKWEKTKNYEELYSIWFENIKKTKWLLNYLADKPDYFHFLRMTSDLLPLVNLPGVWDFYLDKRKMLQKEIKSIGDDLVSRNKKFRMVMHPGQFTLLNSVRDDVNEKAILDLQYHYDMVSAFGFPYSINIHLGAGPTKDDKQSYIDRFVNNYSQLPDYLRECLSIENDEKVCDLSLLIKLYDKVKILICYDHHHQACYMANKDRKGVYEYYDISDEELGVIKESWLRMGINPTTHLSNAKSKDGTWKDYFAHSDYLYDDELNKKVIDISIKNNFDIECEAKAKLPAVEKFHEIYFKSSNEELI
jgi:UV DNA damage endonuclease